MYTHSKPMDAISAGTRTEVQPIKTVANSRRERVNRMNRSGVFVGWGYQGCCRATRNRSRILCGALIEKWVMQPLSSSRSVPLPPRNCFVCRTLFTWARTENRLFSTACGVLSVRASFWLLNCKRSGNNADHPHHTNRLLPLKDTMKRFFFLRNCAPDEHRFLRSVKRRHPAGLHTVSEIAIIAVQGNVSMTINQATAGQAPDAATASATYAVTTNGTQKKITAELDSDMPDGLTLNATMAAPSGASSAGKTELSDKAVDLVTNVTKVRGSGLSLAYEAIATVDADPDNVSRTVTYTTTNN